jgi:hypothetical protein
VLFTYTLIQSASGCEDAASTFSASLTWEVQGTTFQAEDSIYIIYSTNGQYIGICVFPGMTVTSLFPGETLLLVKSTINYY